MGDFTFNQDYVVYQAKKEGIYPIKESDWLRLQRLIKGIIPLKNIFQIMSSLAFGVFASALFTLIAFHAAEKLSTWVLPTTWVIFVVSFIAGVGLLILDSQQKEMITYSTNDVLNEIKEIEKAFNKTDEEE